MAKVSAAGGPSHEGNLQVDPQETYLVDDGNEDVTNATKGNPSYVRDGQLLSDEEVAEWDGTKESPSSEKPKTSDDKSENKSQPPVHNAESLSKSEDGKGKSSASTTGGITRKTG
jgi:hypothetical protein